MIVAVLELPKNNLVQINEMTTTIAPPSSFYDSFPPLFRPIHGVDQDVDVDVEIEVEVEVEPTTYCLDSDPLLVIDLQSLNHQDGKHRLAQACKDWGIFRLVNHGVPTTLLDQIQDLTKELFSLSYETKQAQGFSSPMKYSYGTSGLKPSGAPLEVERGPNPWNTSWIESFNASVSQLSLQAQDPKFDSFRLLLEEYVKHQARLATTIFRAMAENLKLDQEQTKSYLTTSTANLRVSRYPRCYVPNLAWGFIPHTDSSVLTILNHYDVGGFQLLKDDKWLDVPPIPNSLVINLGDMVQAMSDDTYKSVEHRVKANRYQERISIGYFVFPTNDAVIQNSTYKPFTHAEFRAQVLQDLETIGYKLGLQRFKIAQPA